MTQTAGKPKEVSIADICRRSSDRQRRSESAVCVPGRTHVDVFLLSDPEQRKNYEKVLGLILSGDARRLRKEETLALPERTTWAVLVHWQELTWNDPQARLEKDIASRHGAPRMTF